MSELMHGWWLPVLAVVLIWWLGTGIVLWLQDRLTPGSRVAAIVLPLLALLAGGVLIATRSSVTIGTSLTAFAAAVFLWGTLELGHNLGLVTGLHTDRCPEDAIGWRRFRLALGTTLWHELSVLGTGLIVSLLLFGATNPTGPLTFLVLWLMRWSAKLNLFFGVPNFSTEWFPARLAHLASYVRRGPVTAFYPLALTLATIILVLLMRQAWAAVGPARLVYLLPAVLLALAMLEHAFLAMPLPDLELWNRWFRAARTRLPAHPPR